MVGGAAVFITGIGAAAQIAFADPNIALVNNLPAAPTQQNIAQQQSLQSTSMTISAFGAPSSGNEAFETLDFSLPSYGEATGKSSSSSTSGSTAPSFAPFGDEEKSVSKNDVEKKES